MKCLSFLIESGGDLNIADNKGNLIWFSVIKFFPGSTALHKACFNGNIACAEYLISKGANVNVLDVHYTSPLHNAVYNGHKQIVIFPFLFQD